MLQVFIYMVSYGISPFVTGFFYLTYLIEIGPSVACISSLLFIIVE